MNPGETREGVRMWTVWPCDHGGVQREAGKVPPNYACAECGAKPIRVVPLDLLTDLAKQLEARAENAELGTRHPYLREGHAAGLREAAQLLRSLTEGDKKPVRIHGWATDATHGTEVTIEPDDGESEQK